MESPTERLNRNINFLKRNFSTVEIYAFAEQCLMGAEFFLMHWSQWEDLPEYCKTHRHANVWVQNILKMRKLQELNSPDKIKINLDMFHENNHPRNTRFTSENEDKTM